MAVPVRRPACRPDPAGRPAGSRGPAARVRGCPPRARPTASCSATASNPAELPTPSSFSARAASAWVTAPRSSAWRARATASRQRSAFSAAAVRSRCRPDSRPSRRARQLRLVGGQVIQRPLDQLHLRRPAHRPGPDEPSAEAQRRPGQVRGQVQPLGPLGRAQQRGAGVVLLAGAGLGVAQLQQHLAGHRPLVHRRQHAQRQLQQAHRLVARRQGGRALGGPAAELQRLLGRAHRHRRHVVTGDGVQLLLGRLTGLGPHGVGHALVHLGPHRRAQILVQGLAHQRVREAGSARPAPDWSPAPRRPPPAPGCRARPRRTRPRPGPAGAGPARGRSPRRWPAAGGSAPAGWPAAAR